MEISYYQGSDAGVEKLAQKLDSEINPDVQSSFIARFNAMEEGEIEVSKSVYELFCLSKQVYLLSDGAFDVTLSDLSTIWKVDSASLEQYYPNFPSLPPYSQVCELNSTMDKIDAWEKDGKYYLNKSVDNAKLDFGGIAKGYLSDLVFEKLTENGTRSAIIDVSGNLCLLGKNYTQNGEKTDWKIGVSNCYDKGGLYLCGLYLSGNCSAITSGTYERCYTKDGVKVNHIINPKTKMPVGIKYDGEYSNTTDHVVSATVVGESGALCDAVATAVCVMGVKDGAKLVNDLQLSALIATADNKYTTVGSLSFMEGNFYLGSLEEIV